MQKLNIIREYSPQLLVESTTDVSGKKNWYIEGVTLQSEVKNHNKRIYPKSILTEAVNSHISERLASGRAIGELQHPKMDSLEVNLDNVSHRFVSVIEEGNNFRTKALILDTTKGKQVQSLLEGGVTLGISSRAYGSVRNEKGVNYVTGLKIITLGDIVYDPSAPEAFVSGIMESKDWFWSNGDIVKKDLSESIDQYKDIIKKSSKKDLTNAIKIIMDDYFKKIQI